MICCENVVNVAFLFFLLVSTNLLSLAMTSPFIPLLLEEEVPIEV